MLQSQHERTPYQIVLDYAKTKEILMTFLDKVKTGNIEDIPPEVLTAFAKIMAEKGEGIIPLFVADAMTKDMLRRMSED